MRTVTTASISPHRAPAPTGISRPSALMSPREPKYRQRFAGFCLSSVFGKAVVAVAVVVVDDDVGGGDGGAGW